MANEQHIQWLCEGVETWNARRRTDDFRPDFSDTNDLATCLQRAGMVASGGRAHLRGANLALANFAGADLRELNLQQANLEGADIRRAELEGTILVSANLKSANLGGTDLRSADLRGASLERADLGGTDLERADLTGANLKGANLRGADLRETMLERANVKAARIWSDTINDFELVPTDLSTPFNLGQGYLDEMIGDQYTLISDHLTRPTHWLEDVQVIDTGRLDEGKHDNSSKDKPQAEDIAAAGQAQPLAAEASSASIFRAQVDVILQTSAAAQVTSAGIAGQLDYALQIYRQDALTNQLPEDVLLVEKFSDLLKGLATEVAQPEPHQNRLAQQLQEMERTIAELTAMIEAQATEIAALKSAPSDTSNWNKMKSSFATSFGKTMGSATAGAIVAGSGYLLGTYGGESVALLGNAFSKLFAVAPPAPLPSGTTLL